VGTGVLAAIVVMLKAGLTPRGDEEQEEFRAPGNELVQLVDQTQVAGPSKLTSIG
jgi:hypothetical protein